MVQGLSWSRRRIPYVMIRWDTIDDGKKGKKTCAKLDVDFIMMGWEEEEDDEVDAVCDEYLEFECGMIDSAIELFVSVSAQTAQLDLKMGANVRTN